MQEAHLIRRCVAVGFLLIYVLATMTTQVVQAVRLGPRPWHPWLQPDQLVALRASLPERGVVGFLSPPDDVPTSAWVNRGADYFWTQFDLAPLVLVPNADPELVLVNTRDPALARSMGARAGLAVRTDLGGGLVVFEHRLR